MRWNALLSAALLLSLPSVPAAERSDAYTLAVTPLNAQPFNDAAAVATLPAHSEVNVVLRRGGWYQVSSASGTTGWLRMTALAFDQVPTKTRSSTLAGILSLFESGRSGSGAAGTAVRGLNTGDIAKAQPDTAAVDNLKNWMATPEAARRYSAELPLRPHSVDYVDADGKPVKP